MLHIIRCNFVYVIHVYINQLQMLMIEVAKRKEGGSRTSLSHYQGD